MTYKYLKSSPNYGMEQNEVWKTGAQELVNQQFENASDVWTIKEETSFSSDVYQDIKVRVISHVINSVTGLPLGDDYKKILFKDFTHDVSLGYMYQFDGNYWLTINPEKIKNVFASSIVKRCNNTLRWIDADGNMNVVPCIIDYEIKQNMDYTGSSSLAITPTGTIQVLCQYNSKSNKIKPNQKFLLGNANNWNAYKVVGGGVNNYNNLETSDNTTARMIRITMKSDYLGDNDDTVNGIAYDDKLQYSLSLNQTVITGIIGDTIQLYATVKMNGSTVDRDVTWSSSKTSRATVSNTGLVTLISNGTATITCSLGEDTSVKDTASVTVSAIPSDNYQVIISPDENYVLEGDTITYTFYLYKNDIQQGDGFTFSLDYRTVPTDNFGYLVVDGNHFSVENKEKCLTDYLVVTGTSGAYSRTQDINLKGSW